MLNELAYCPRLFHLEWVQSEWQGNADTAAGSHQHAAQDRPKGRVPEAGEEPESVRANSVWLSAPHAGLTAKLDLLEDCDGGVRPVEYKRGKGPRDQGVWEPDEVQVGAQLMILRENGYTVDHGIVAYRDAKRRERVDLTDSLEARVRSLRDEALELSSRSDAPAPLEDSPKCPRCSLVAICMPDEVRFLPGKVQAGAPAAGRQRIRRLVQPHLHAQPLIVHTAGTRLSKTGDHLTIKPLDGPAGQVRWIDISELSLLGGVQVSTQVLHACFRADIPVAFFSAGGWFQGFASAPGGRNALRRFEQYRLICDADARMHASRMLIRRKIRNCRSFLRRNSRGDVAPTLDELRRLSERVSSAESASELLGLEGLAAKAYFGAFDQMLRSEDLAFQFTKRNRRPPSDPVNALLSLAYATLAKDWTAALQAVGLDPYLGFFHRPKHGKPALALDLMEEFRPLIADSVVVQVINNGEVESKHFVQRGPACNLNENGRRKFYEAYGRRMNGEVTHPLLGYSVSYRRLLLIQARLFSRHAAGELADYPGFETR